MNYSLSRPQPPVYSPLTLRAVLSGLAATVTGGRAPRREVRQLLREKFAPDQILLTDSGTTALTLVLQAIRAREPNGAVAIPAYSCFDVATAAVGADVPVLLYDVDPRTLSPDVDSLRATLEEGAVAVVITHLFGIPTDLSTVMQITADADVPLIEDAAQAAAGRYRDVRLGRFGSVSILSFGRGKGITGCGGGAMLARDSSGFGWLNRAGVHQPLSATRGWRQLPDLVGQWLLGRPGLYAIPSSIPALKMGETVYREPKPLRGMTSLSAGTLSVTLSHEEGELRVRRRNARRLKRFVEPIPGISVVEAGSDSEPGYLRFPVLASNDFPGKMSKEGGKSLGVYPAYPKSLSKLEALREHFLNRSWEFPGAEYLAENLFTLPTHRFVGEEELAALRQCLHRAS